MVTQHKKLLDDLDDLMIALSKQRNLGIQPDVMIALRELTKSRNKFKKMYIEQQKASPKTIVEASFAATMSEEMKQTIFTHLLDNVSDAVA